MIRRYFRKKLLLPAEHGSWSWLLVPYFAGVLVAGDINLPALLVLIGGLAGFLVRQPASTYLRIRAGRARKSDGPIAALWVAFFALVALICFARIADPEAAHGRREHQHAGENRHNQHNCFHFTLPSL